MKAPIDKLLADLEHPLTEDEAKRICALGPEVVVVVLMHLSAHLPRNGQAGQAQTGPHTPSSAIPPYEKSTQRRRGKKRGGKPGHAGHRRPRPEDITRRVKHPPLKHCPHCGSTVCKPKRERTRYVEDIPDVQPEVTEHAIPQQWCPSCNKHVEPVVDEAMPKATFGHRVVVLAAWLHYGLAMTLSQVVSLLRGHMHFDVSEGGLVDAWHRLANLLASWYEQIGEEIKASAVLFADETGWRVNTHTHWLWCFTTSHATFYMINRSRGSPALNQFFTESFDGVLVTDFWAAYHAVECADRQVCLAHLLRELASVDERDRSEAWGAFSKKLKRLLRDALRLKARSDLLPAERQQRVLRIHRRLQALLTWESVNADVLRILKRLRRHQDFLFAFLDYEDVTADNNHAEREIRLAVTMRKNSYCNRSDAGASTQGILMSVYRTLKLRGYEPLPTIVDALKTYVRTGQMPPLPGPDVVRG